MLAAKGYLKRIQAQLIEYGKSLNWLSVGVFLLVAFALFLPVILSKGYLAIGDMSPPTFHTDLQNTARPSNPAYLADYIARGLSSFLGGWMFERLVIIACVVATGLGAYRLVREVAGLESARPLSADALLTPMGYFAGLLYVVNPFTYSRLMSGQYLVLLSYGLLPLVCVATVQLLRKVSYARIACLGLSVFCIGLFSVHYVVVACVCITVLTFRWVIMTKEGTRARFRGVGSILVAVLIFAILSSYWLGPALLGKGQVADNIANFTPSDQTAFQTVPGHLGLTGNVLALQGFWGDARNLYLLPQDLFAWWLLPIVALWLLVAGGMVVAWKKQRDMFAVFAALGFIGFVLAVGGAGTIFAPFNDWLFAHVPFFAGYREPQKFAALIALAYTYFGAMGVYGAGKLLEKTSWRNAVWLLLAIPVLCAPLLLWGGAGQLHTGNYPQGWYQANTYLRRHDTSDAKVLFLPWHLYMPFSFAGGNTLANPAPKFFVAPIVSSQDPELGGAHGYSGDPAAQTFEATILPGAQSDPELAPRLAALHIRYVIVANEYDYKTYNYLAGKPGLRLVLENRSLRVYQVNGSMYAN